MKDFFGIRSTRQLIRSTWEELDLRIKFEDIVDDCTTASSVVPLSARQGKALRDLIRRIDSDDDGTVDNAKLLDGHPSSYYAKHDVADVLVNSLLAQPNGICPLDNTGHVSSEFLPSYVDDVMEVWLDLENNKIYEDEAHKKPMAPEKGKIYINLHDDISYRWSGSRLQDISSPDMVELTEDEVIDLWNKIRNEVHNRITNFVYTPSADKTSAVLDGYVSSDNANSVMIINFLTDTDAVLGSMTTDIGETRSYHFNLNANVASTIIQKTKKVSAIVIDSSNNSALSEAVNAIIVA